MRSRCKITGLMAGNQTQIEALSRADLRGVHAGAEVGKPTISVIMPTYNGERFLRPAIESVLSQSFCDVELLVIDDGSTDSTPAILRECAAQDERMIVLTNPQNLGIAAATNRGLAAARGEYIALQDHDDISLPHRFQAELDFLRSHPDIAVVGSSATLIDDEGVAYAEFPLPCEEIDIKWRLLFVGDALHYTSVIVRRDALQSIGGYGEDPAFRFSEAYDPFSRLAMRYRIVNLPDRLVLWRRHPGATSRQHGQEQMRSGDIISARNISLLCNFPAARDNHLDHCVEGFKAFALMPAGELPRLPAEQVISGLKFILQLRKSFYRVHSFSRSAIARHCCSLSRFWGKHAIALSVRAPWSLRERMKVFCLGMRCLWNWVCAGPLSLAATGRHDRITVPTIKLFSSSLERPA